METKIWPAMARHHVKALATQRHPQPSRRVGKTKHGHLSVCCVLFDCGRRRAILTSFYIIQFALTKLLHIQSLLWSDKRKTAQQNFKNQSNTRNTLLFCLRKRVLFAQHIKASADIFWFVMRVHCEKRLATAFFQFALGLQHTSSSNAIWCANMQTCKLRISAKPTWCHHSKSFKIHVLLDKLPAARRNNFFFWRFWSLAPMLEGWHCMKN